MANRHLIDYHIYILPVDGGIPKKLDLGIGACDPRWSPTGTKFTYQAESHIFTIDADGKNSRQESFGAGVQYYSTWGPKEENIAYCRGRSEYGPWQIYVASLLEDEDLVKIAKEGSNMYPDWGTVSVSDN